MSAISTTTKAAILGRREVLHWVETLPGEQVAVRLYSRDVGGAFLIVEVAVPPLAGPPIHFHKEREEIFEVLEGKFRFRCDGEEFDVEPGETIVAPRGVAHGWTSLGPGPGRILSTFVPGGIDEIFSEEFFRELRQTPPEDWLDLACRHDTWIVGAPLRVQYPTR